LATSVMVERNRILAFLEKGFRIMISYRFGFLLRCLYVLGFVTVFYFFGRIFDIGNAPALAQYGGDYVAFVLIGFAFQDLYRTALSVYPNTILSEQKSGTLEYLLATNVGLQRFLHYSSFWGYSNALINTAIVLVIGILIFGADLKINILSALTVAVLMVLSVACLGLIAAGIVLVVKQGNPIDFVFNVTSLVFSGVIFPPTVLPASMQAISEVLPLTHALHALRLAVLQEYSPQMLMSEITVLLIYVVALLPVAILVLRWGYNRARREGSLAQY